MTALASTLLSAPPAGAADAASSAFLADINDARDRHGLDAYRDRDDLDAMAQRWAERMAAHQALEHNPDLSTQAGDWRELAENVGSGPDEDSIHRAFMHSADHRDNILSPSLRQVGVGTARDSDGVLYVDEVFRTPS